MRHGFACQKGKWFWKEMYFYLILRRFRDPCPPLSQDAISPEEGETMSFLAVRSFGRRNNPKAPNARARLIDALFPRVCRYRACLVEFLLRTSVIFPFFKKACRGMPSPRQGCGPGGGGKSWGRTAGRGGWGKSWGRALKRKKPRIEKARSARRKNTNAKEKKQRGALRAPRW